MVYDDTCIIQYFINIQALKSGGIPFILKILII